MPILYSLVDRLSDVLIAAVNPAKRARNRDYDRESSLSPAPKLHHRRREYDYDDPDDDHEPLSYYGRGLSPQFGEEVATPIAEEGDLSGIGYSNSSNNDKGVRYCRTPRHGKSVHWGGISNEFLDGVPEASAPGLSEYPQRRTKKSQNYVYGADYGAERQSSSRNLRKSRRESPSRSGSGSGIGILETPDSHEEAEAQEQPSIFWSPHASSLSFPSSLPGRRQLLHRTHVPRKSILKTPTTLDDEMLIRNLWAMVSISDSRLDYTYEFLAGVLLVGDKVLDTMWSAGEMMMYEEARRRQGGGQEGCKNGKGGGRRANSSVQCRGGQSLHKKSLSMCEMREQKGSLGF
ncbi:predicted protein [Aspergillus nidulans FGSC A4]|uniref:Uncharacterized protein n=1 Tax=Emericella nidulans (strain FGSC A4 / ATCC 38163 / CBS 112.46 / NRRL 194 / M139) TaxID=227321 RepID=Q5B2U5_EMENI|nr:hypothetical protein [Aspergillus nidulans FGSC A4]EAA62316.1 predicted protein [Aspergillus nidulans FGSC A4]CBF80925.1 TPA: conserved hypothetical protein [Aspergillus nidulans FGSC A4]|eukprot:XP_662739.1 predicted protein [Aspergillus nidulans FGSC A4]